MAVRFSVEAEAWAGEAVFVTGDSSSLGDWTSDGAVEMERSTEQSKCRLWDKEIAILQKADCHYRFFIGRRCGVSPHRTLVTKWETNLRPRTLRASETETGALMFGRYDGQENVDKGWLTTQTEVRLRFYGNPVHLCESSPAIGCYSFKCLPFDFSQGGADIKDTSSQVPISAVQVACLDGIEDCFHDQHIHGKVLPKDGYLDFRSQTLSPSETGFNIEIYAAAGACTAVEDRDLNGSDLLGTSVLLPKLLGQASQDVISLPITDKGGATIGTIAVDYLLIRPMPNWTNSLEVCHTNRWSRRRRPLDIGHRGMGSSYKGKQRASVKENTIAAFNKAGHHGADYVEFDVQLTKDKVPVIYHDLIIRLQALTRNGETKTVAMAIQDLTFAEINSLQIEHQSKKNDNMSPPSNGCAGEVSAPGTVVDEHAFPTLVECLQKVAPDVGFNIEIKNCLRLKTGELEDGCQYFMDRNEYVDLIAQPVLQHAAARRVVFSCFDPDVCTILRLKQNRYPVQFLSQGETLKYDPYLDLRTNTTPIAYSFARVESLMGVNPHVEDLLKDPSLIDLAVNCGLVVLPWGEDNNNANTIAWLKEKGAHGVIYDRINEFKKGGENIFKKERLERS